jgi:hypothetical protein
MFYSEVTYHLPVSPSHSPLMRSPVMHPSSKTSSATKGSRASRAANALLWICAYAHKL